MRGVRLQKKSPERRRAEHEIARAIVAIRRGVQTSWDTKRTPIINGNAHGENDGARDEIRAPTLQKTRQGLEGDMADLRAEKGAPIEFSDVAYYNDQIKQKKLKLDSEKVREHFPAWKVLEGTFAIYEKLFSVKFEKTKGFPLWHKDAEIFAVKERGKTIAHIILDLYPREGKYTHACMIQIARRKKSSW